MDQDKEQKPVDGLLAMIEQELSTYSNLTNDLYKISGRVADWGPIEGEEGKDTNHPETLVGKLEVLLEKLRYNNRELARNNSHLDNNF